jgi:hypothetical protein
VAIERATTTSRPSGLRIIVAGYIVRGPLGGLAWHHLQYVLGLVRLGHDVLFIEDSDDYPCCYDPERNMTDADPTYGLAFAARAFDRLGLESRWAYHDAHRSQWCGPAGPAAERRAAAADLLLDLSGVNPLRPWLLDIPRRALVDTDPAFTQIKHLTRPDALAAARRHTSFFTFGENVGKSGATIPDDGLPWQPTRQPIVLDAWTVTPGPERGKLTTVMQWESYPALEHDGCRYGMKSDSFESIVELPRRVGKVFELAIGSPSAPRARLRDMGWSVRDPLRPTRDPWSYQAYIRRSRGEFGVAKHGYVVSDSGWFSERSAAYLASGRPVVVQETGFSRWLSAGSGVLPFRNLAEAAAGVEELRDRYVYHCHAARAIAEEYFDSRQVLDRLVTRAMSETTLTRATTPCAS